MKKREEQTWTTMEDVGVYDRFLLTKFDHPLKTPNFQGDINLRKQYEGFMNRELEFITTYMSALFGNIGNKIIPNYFAHTQASNTRKATPEEQEQLKKAEIITPARTIFGIGLMDHETGPNGSLENALKSFDDRLLHELIRNTQFNDYSKVMFESDLKFVRNQLKESGTNNLLRFKGFYGVPKENLYSKLLDVEFGAGKLRAITSQLKNSSYVLEEAQ